MTEDFSRNNFSRPKNYSLVRMQQGRLFADADWNEQGDILRGADRENAADIIGHAGFPQGEAGFAVSVDAATEALLIGPGTGYVAGVRHVLGAPEKLEIAKSSGNGANIVWKITAGGELRDGVALASGPGAGASLHIVKDFDTAQDGARTFRSTPKLNDDATEAFKITTVARQPFAPDLTKPQANGTYIALLKSFDLPITALDDPALREIAFDGPDTATPRQNDLAGAAL